MTTLEAVGIIAVAFIGLGLVVAAISYTSGYKEREAQQALFCHAMLELFARRNSLHFDPRGLKVDGTLDGMGVFVAAAYDQLEPGIPAMVTMSTLARASVPVLVQAAPSKWSLAEWIASNRVETGDAKFDSAFKVWTDDADVYADLLGEAVRQRILGLAPDELLYNRGVMELRWEEDCKSSVEDAALRLDSGIALLRLLGAFDA